ncbi:hypothetical protein C1T31_10100 [Hanstruepera neustonica]|uniref:DUF5655 domain-containing protein n=1 Tax=Hanstruepera neustonica TaxID=1445657 RepID=A0A2K1DXV8_9FLAO|nr:hypothetical protein [Hanstruepera neustonica]PNQ72847.1 hypothetical protein C1T31_10100 [Hanstruepera neustonica]
MKYVKTDAINLRDHGFNEKWLQDIIEEDPSIIGLGEIEVYRRERKQTSGGRIDFLMLSADSTTMYEVEIMLGATDESHIIRTIEYWDLERRRFPSREHRAVLIAENITNRFFNVISLMNKSIPIIAIQLNAFKHEDKVFLDFVKVLDIYESPEDEEDLGLEVVDRKYWENKSAKSSIKLLDEIIAIASEGFEELRVTYNKHHVALGTSQKNCIWLRPRKTEGYCHIELLTSEQNIEETKMAIEAIGQSYTIRKEKIIAFAITKSDYSKNRDLIKEIIGKTISIYK